MTIGNRKLTAQIALAFTLVVATACNVGPKYIRPSTPIPPAYKEGASTVEGSWRLAEPADVAGRGKWWERFGDSQLNALEEQVAISNQNIAAAAANVSA